MSNLQPFNPARSVPLTGGARFIRGFKRVGLVLGALALIIGLAVTGTIAVDQQRSAERRFEAATCINDRVRNNWPIKMKTYDSSKIDFEATGCPSGPFYYETVATVASYARSKPAPLEYTLEPLSYGTLFSVAIASILFFGFWLIGWLCAGFTRD